MLRISLCTLFAASLLNAGCGDDPPTDRPFVLAQVSVAHLVKQGMEKEIISDTLVRSVTIPARDSAVSSDGTKRVWCDGARLIVQDVADGQRIVLHEEEAPSGVVVCFSPTFVDDGSEVHFYQLIEDPASDSTFQKTRVIIALGEGE